MTLLAHVSGAPHPDKGERAFKTSSGRAAAHSGHKQCPCVQFFSGFLPCMEVWVHG